MPQIPEFARRSLTSSVVGTPGESREGAIVGGAIESAAGTGLKIELAEQAATEEKAAQEAERIRAAQEKLLAKRQEAADKMESNRRKAEFNNALEGVYKDAADENDFLARANKLLDESMAAISSDGVKAVFGEDASALMVAKNDAFRERHSKKQLERLGVEINGVTESQASGIYNVFADPDYTLSEKISSMNTQLDLALRDLADSQEALGLEAHAKYRTEKLETITKAAINALMESSPQDVEPFIDAVVKDSGVLPPEEISKLRQEAVEYGKKQQAVAEHQQKIAVDRADSDLGRRMTSGDPEEEPTIQEIENAMLKGEISKEMGEMSLKVKKSAAKEVTEDDKREAFAELQSEFNALEITKKGDKAKATATFEQLALFRAHTMDAIAQGKITQATGKLWLREVDRVFAKKGMEGIAESVNARQVPRGIFEWDGLEEVLTTPVEKADVLMSAQKELMRRIHEEEDRTQSPISAEQVAGIVEDIKQNTRVRTDRSKYSPGQIVQTKDGPKMAKYWDPLRGWFLDADLKAKPNAPK